MNAREGENEEDTSASGGTLVDDATQTVLGYLSGSLELIEVNIQEGQSFVPGPPLPPERSTRSVEAEARELIRTSALLQIEALERSSLRWLRELALTEGDGSAERDQLRKIHLQVAALDQRARDHAPKS